MKTLADVPVTQLKGVGQALATRLEKLQIFSIQDLLFHLPFRYQDRTRIIPIADLQVGDQGVLEGIITDCRVVFGRRRSLQISLRDGTGTIQLRFFYFSAAQQKQLVKGSRLRCFGEIRLGGAGLECYHPEYRTLKEEGVAPVEEALTPIYPLTEGVQQSRIRSLCQMAIGWLDRYEIKDWLPQSLLSQYHFFSISESVRFLHQPPVDADKRALEKGCHPCQQRLIFEELLTHHLSLLLLRRKMQAHQALPLPSVTKLSEKLLETLPFQLTSAQQKVLVEIRKDMMLHRPMLRLVQGDVGSGKTIVAALAALHAIEAGKQVAIMAPTEILAEQHWVNFNQWLSPLGIQLAWLSGRTKGKKRDAALQQIESGGAQVVIGTHALFQNDVQFAQLALVIVDEQHRFGVHQRLALRDKGFAQGFSPHQLIMTATPIPRTLAMSAYADLDCSVIDELPPGRKPIQTLVLPDSRRVDVIERVRQACLDRKQAYWVCTLIEESDALQCQAAEATALQLSIQLPELRVGLVHGRLKPAEKQAVMDEFKLGNTDLLVATTVIEVGVDVPDASLIIIENPERLGLAQLHQLRGRVGRGHAESFCVLMYHPPLSKNSKARLATMRATNDGFQIAEKDLELRGPGEVLGTRQTGLMNLKVADLTRDGHWLPQVQQAAKTMIQDSDSVDRLINRWLGKNVEYGTV
jgi:ATP-dependent DNA helicase RecG